MKVRLSRAVALIGMILLASAVAQAAEIHNGAFAVTMPDGFGAFARQPHSVNAGIETDTWVAKAPTGEAVVVSVSKMPAKITDPTKALDSTRDSLLKSVKGTLENEENVQGTLPSRRLTFSSGTAFLTSRLIVDGDRLVNVLYVGRSAEQRAVPAVAQIFDSFQIAPEAVAEQNPAASDQKTAAATPKVQ